MLVQELKDHYREYPEIKLDAVFFSSTDEFIGESGKIIDRVKEDAEFAQRVIDNKRNDGWVNCAKNQNQDDDWRFGKNRNLDGLRADMYNPDMELLQRCREGIKKLMSTKHYKDLMKESRMNKSSVRNVEAGGRLDVARYLSGGDNIFKKLRSYKKATPSMKILISSGISCGQKDKEIAELFEMVIPAVYAIEFSGIPVELYVANCCCTGLREDKKFNKSMVVTKIKSSERNINMSDALMFSKVGLFRMNCFSIMGTMFGEAAWGLGTPSKLNKKEIDHIGFSAFVGYDSREEMGQIQGNLIKIAGIQTSKKTRSE